jgi:transcriptional regulator GlxA family with amidase domain
VFARARVLMAAGLLDSRQSTPHWRASDLLASMCPATDGQRDRVFALRVEDSQ